MKLIITTESTCDLTREQAAQNNIICFDMSYFIDGVDYIGKSAEESELYKKMREGKKSSTSQINEETYYEHFKALTRENLPILHLAFSSGLSATYFGAKAAADRINEEEGKQIVWVVDSLCACSGHGFYDILVSRFAQKASSMEEVVNYAEDLKLKINHIFSVDKLKYLVNGGRVSSAAAIIGKILNIKPIMKTDNLGKLVVTSKVIGRHKALCSLCDLVVKNIDLSVPEIFIGEADCLEDANFVSSVLKEKLGITPTINKLGPIIGAHSGPGTISIYFVGKER